MKNNEKTLLTATDVGRTFQCHPKTVLGWAASGKLPAVRLGPRCVRFRPEDVEKLIADRLTGTR